MVTVKLTAVLVKPPTTTVTASFPSVAVGAITKVAVTVVSFTTVNWVTVTPLPDTFTAVVPIRPMPVRVTAVL